jgi:D-alanyl-D-alanine carboxypeptidase/D-alanyl-D-alanine-endopeptidase (penicillin-binding protein 4)
VRIATIESPPVFEIAAVVLKNSQNLYSEMLLRAAAGGAAPISYEQAFARERLFLTSEVGLDGSQFGFADGSGLSVENMVTPRAIVQTFRYLWEPPRRELFRALLATPGESGTLRQRLGGMEATMRGKTGTIDGVSALSGYVLMPEGDPRFFAILVNHHLSDSDHAEEVLDRIARRIAQR